MAGATEQLASFGLGVRLEDVPAQAAENAKLLLLDTLGVMLAAASLPIGRKVLSHVERLGGASQASVIGAAWQTAAPLAALANGTLASAVDFDGFLHVTTYVVPSALAAAELAGTSGKLALEAMVAGYEIGLRLSEGLDPDRQMGVGVSSRGWFHVGFVGPIVSALVAGKVLGLSLNQLRGAIGLAAATSGGLRRNFGTPAKAYTSGHGANQGLHAALLAADGLDGDPEIVEAPLGLLGALGLTAEGLQAKLDTLGHDWTLLGSLGLKRYPACSPAHVPVKIALDLQAEHGFAAEEVESIEADLHDQFSLIRLHPRDEIAAGFSLPFLLGVALVDGRLSLDQLTDERIEDPRVRTVMERVRRAESSKPEKVTVRLKDGRSLSGELSSARLDAGDELEAKYADCAARTLTAARARELREAALSLDRLGSVGELMALARS